MTTLEGIFTAAGTADVVGAPHNNNSNYSFPHGTSCISKNASLAVTDWCIERCLGGTVLSDADYGQCKDACHCHVWDYTSVNYLLIAVGGLSLATCLAMIILDLQDRRVMRSAGNCLRWANFCNFFYSLFFFVYAIVDEATPMQEFDSQRCLDPWAGFVGAASCNRDGHQPFCFLNCCNFAVPWLEFFGYGSLLWSACWLADLVRYVMQPLAPEKFLGVSLIVFYHALAWTLSVLIAVGLNFDRLDLRQCRRAQVVMMPCILRKADIEGSLPLLHLVGFLFIGVAVAYMARRYIMVRPRLGPQENVSNSVRLFLRTQWFHAGMLALCWIVIMADAYRECSEDRMSYASSVPFAGMGLLLNLDRLLEKRSALKHQQRLRSLDAPAAPDHQGGLSSPLTPPRMMANSPRGSTSGTSSPRGAPRLQNPGEVVSFRLVDFAGLLENISAYLAEEQTMAGYQREFLRGATDSAGTDGRLALLRRCAQLDDHPDVQADLLVAPRPSAGSDVTFRVVAPRTFTYLRRLWGLSIDRVLRQLEFCDANALWTPSKSGSSLLVAPDGITFTLKTVSESEISHLRTFLPMYRQHVERHPASLLCRLYGCFTLTNGFGSQLHVVLMDCISGPCGGTGARSRNNSSWSGDTFRLMNSTSNEDWALRNIDANGELQVWNQMKFDIKSEFQDGGFLRQFPDGLTMRDGARDELCDGPLVADYEFLSQMGIVDYSVLLTVWTEGEPPSADDVAHGSAGCFAVSADRAADPGLTARMGFIDFLVPFNMWKRSESALKRAMHLRHGSERVTITDPRSYADRQRNFLFQKVFPPNSSSSGP